MLELFFGFIWKKARKERARRLFEEIVNQSRQPSFYRQLGIPDTLDGRFELVVLHTFLIVRQLRHDKFRRQLGRDIMTLLFDDFDLSLRETGVGDMGMGRRIKTMADGFYGRSEAYELGLADRGTGLADAIARNIFRDVHSKAALASLEAYVRREARAIEDCSEADLLSGKVVYGPAPE